jgi:hypothetical protein
MVKHESRNRAVGIATGYGLGGAGVRFPGGERDFSLLSSVQTDSGAHPASYSTATEDFSPVGKAAEA